MRTAFRCVASRNRERGRGPRDEASQSPVGAQPSREESISFLSPAQAAGAPTFCDATESRQRSQPRGLRPLGHPPPVLPSLAKPSCGPTPPPREGRTASFTASLYPKRPLPGVRPKIWLYLLASRRQRNFAKKSPTLVCRAAPRAARGGGGSRDPTGRNFPTDRSIPARPLENHFRRYPAPPTVFIRAPAKSCSNAYPAFERFRTLGAARGSSYTDKQELPSGRAGPTSRGRAILRIAWAIRKRKRHEQKPTKPGKTNNLHRSDTDP